MEINEIQLTVFYYDEDGQLQSMRKNGAKSFESAEENLGKLQRAIEKIIPKV